MARYRTFTRTWWADDDCTVPEPGEKDYSESEEFEDWLEAGGACREYNIENFGPTRRGPRGLCMEFEET